MRRMFAVIISGLWACLSVAPAAAQCPSPREVGVTPNITVQPIPMSPRYIYNINRNQLTQITRQINNGTNHGVTLGLTVSRYLPAAGSYKSKSIKKGNQYCHYIINMNVKLSLADLIVYIASEYKQGTCQAQVITTHENEHVRVHQAVLQKYAPIMREALLRQANLAFAGSIPDSQTVINRAISSTIREVLNNMMAEQSRGNGAIDTQDSYRRTAQRCKQW